MKSSLFKNFNKRPFFTVLNSLFLFFGRDFITITKAENTDWQVLKPLILSAVIDHYNSEEETIIQEKDFIKKVITFDELTNVENNDKYLRFDSIINDQLIQNINIKNENLKRNSAACIIYTSGTSGNP